MDAIPADDLAEVDPYGLDPLFKRLSCALCRFQRLRCCYLGVDVFLHVLLVISILMWPGEGGNVSGPDHVAVLVLLRLALEVTISASPLTPIGRQPCGNSKSPDLSGSLRA